MGLIANWRYHSTSEVLQRSSHTVDIIDGYAYVFGGELLPRQPRDSIVYGFDLRAKDDNVQQVETSSETPLARVGSASAVLDGKIYMFSGRGGEAMSPLEEQGALWVFDPKRTAWSLLAPANLSDVFPPARSYHCAASDGERRIYIHAGCPASGRLSDLWSFDVVDKKWSQQADAPAPPRGGSSIAFMHGKLYRMNGFDGDKEQGGSLDVYNPGSNTWDFLPYAADGISGPSPRSVGALLPISFDNKLFLVTLFGEGDPSALGHAGAGKMFDDVWAFDIAEERWHMVDAKRDYDRIPPSRGWFDAGNIDKSTILVVGGLAEDNERLQDAWSLAF